MCAHRIFASIRALTSHQHLPQLVDHMPPACAKDLAFHLCGCKDRSGYYDDSTYEYLLVLLVTFKGYLLFS